LKSNVKGEEDKVASGLAALHHEDPTFLYMVDSELHQTILSAQGELHLEVIADRLRKRYNVHVELTEPRVRYRETIRGKGDSKYRHKKQTAAPASLPRSGCASSPSLAIPGLNSPITGGPKRRPRVRALGREGSKQGLGGRHPRRLPRRRRQGRILRWQDAPVDSKDIAFQIAGYFAFKESFMAAKPCLLEPIYTVEIRIPEDAMGKVMGDLSSRRGKIQGMDMDGTFQVIKAHVPAKELYRYSSTLRSLTGGRSVHSEEFSHYEEMPATRSTASSRKATSTAASPGGMKGNPVIEPRVPQAPVLTTHPARIGTDRRVKNHPTQLMEPLQRTVELALLGHGSPARTRASACKSARSFPRQPRGKN